MLHWCSVRGANPSLVKGKLKFAAIKFAGTSLPPLQVCNGVCNRSKCAAISLCGQRQSLGWALELVADMRSRGVACNVHTYSALMNTCIKCGELELALDVFYQLKVSNSMPHSAL